MGPRAHRFFNLPGGFAGFRVVPGSPPSVLPILDSAPTAPGVAAISASNLQGTYFGSGSRTTFRPEDDFYAPLRSRQPLEILGGGSIYLYEVGPMLSLPSQPGSASR
jgi:hypothetical protein